MIGFAIAARVRRPEPDSRRSAVNAPNGPLSIARGVRSLLREDSARKTEALGHLREARIALQRVEKRRIDSGRAGEKRDVREDHVRNAKKASTQRKSKSMEKK